MSDQEGQDAVELRRAALDAVAADGRTLRDVPEALRGDREVVGAAVAQTGVALQFASEALKDDRDIVLAAVSQTWVALEYASETQRADSELVLIALAQSGLALKDASDELRADEGIVRKALQNDGMALSYASEALRAKVDVVVKACDKDPQALQFASEELRDNLELVCPLVREDGTVLRFASEAIRKNRDVVLDACTTYGLALCWVPEKLRDDLEVVTKAVEQCGIALAYASARLQNDDRVVRVAARQDAQALEYASLALRNDHELVLDIVDRDGRGLKWAADLRDNDEIVIMAVKDCGTALAEASVRLREDRKAVLTAVRQDGRALLFACSELRADKEVVLEAVRQHGAALAHASEEQLHDHKICRAALAQDGTALAFVPEELRHDRETVIAAVTQRGTALQYAPYDLRGDTEAALAAINQGGEEAVEFVSLDLKRDNAFVEFALAQNPKIPGALEGLPRPLVRKFALAKARRFLEPIIKEEHDIGWLEALPALRMISPLSELESAFTDPEGFVEGLASRPERIAQAWALARARPALQPKIDKYGIAWDDMLVVLKFVSLKDLGTALEDPGKFLEELAAKRVGPIAKWFLIAQLRPGLEPLMPASFPWTDTARVLDAIETTKELKDFLEGGCDLLFWKLQNGGEWPATKTYAKVMMRLKLEPQLPGEPRPHWDDFFLVLQELHEEGDEGDYEEEDTLKWAIANLKSFFQRQRMDPHLRTAKLWAFALLRPLLEVELERQGNTFEEILPMLEEMDTMRDLQAALDAGDKGIAALLERVSVGPVDSEDPNFPTSPKGPIAWEHW